MDPQKPHPNRFPTKTPVLSASLAPTTRRQPGARGVSARAGALRFPACFGPPGAGLAVRGGRRLRGSWKGSHFGHLGHGFGGGRALSRGWGDWRYPSLWGSSKFWSGYIEVPALFGVHVEVPGFFAVIEVAVFSVGG